MGTEFGTGFDDALGGETAGRAAAAEAVSELTMDRTDFAIVFCSPTYECSDVVEGVRSVVGDIDIVGATAVGEFTEQGLHTSLFTDRDGVTVALVASDEMQFFTGFGRNVSDDPEASVSEATANLPTSVEGYPHLTGLMLSSATFAREELAMHTYQQLPIEWAGGGALDATFENMTVFCGDQMGGDAVVLTVIASQQPLALGIGTRHKPIGGSFEVTKSDGYVVHELDGKPAYDVWKQAFAETAEEQYGFSLEEIESDRQRLFQAFTELVFGIRTGDDEYKVRSPYLTAHYNPYTNLGSEDPQSDTETQMEVPTLGTLPEGALQFGHPIPEGVVLYPMTSGQQETIDRGTQSVTHALADIGDRTVAGGIVFDCPCGEVTLRENYPELVEAIAQPIGAPLIGTQSGGDEVCYRHDDMRGVHETSTSVLLFPEGDQP